MTHGNAHRRHIAKRDVHRVRVRGHRAYWHFTFSERWGPMLTDEWGEPISSVPLADEEHPFWDAFEAWLRGVDGTAPRTAPQASYPDQLRDEQDPAEASTP